ncbi:hypothetical protein AX14_009332 [Amanita brunnescens Koide BX004]|nr:hypothetical protein AX14_009332 [Amanita brunnescens Koide BX004]
MFELISEADVIPRSLYITDVSTDFSRIGAGGYGRVLGGKYQQKLVALKVIDKEHKDINQEFCQEALAWRSLSHPYILPLLGIFRDNISQMFLVSPYVENGTFSDWRTKNNPPVLSEIHRLMIEAAEGVRYIHSEGLVHGDLKGANILLDSHFHCRIVDFGLTRHSDATATGNVAFDSHFAAPELFGKCTKCDESSCDGTLPGHEIQRKKTLETDVYAFGCLYYELFFDTIPFGKHSTFYTVSWYVINGKRPPRLESPKMEDSGWNLIQSCWKSEPSERPKMEQIVSALRQL